MVKIIKFLIIFGCSNIVLAQDYSQYYQLSNKAYTLYAKKEYPQAIIAYKKAFKEKFPFPDDVNFALQCCLAIDDKKNALKMLELLIKSGYNTVSETPIYISSQPKRFFDPLPIQDSVLEKKFLAKQEQWRKQYLKQVDFKADQYLQSLRVIEAFVQILRREYDSDTTYAFGTAGFDQASLLMVNLLKYNKDINRDKTNCWSDRHFIAAIIHATQSLEGAALEELYALLREQIIKGNLHPMQYAEIYDSFFAQRDLPIKYGQHLNRYYGENGVLEKELPPIENMEQIDAIRAEIFLPPFWAYLRVQNIDIIEK